MELTNDFDVPAGIDQAWAALTDIELIAPCMPGARLTEVEGDTYRGTVKVKVGPISAQFKGEATFADVDADTHRAVLKASGRDTTGKGNANATITAQLTSTEHGTHVSILTDLAISGRVAQFGRGALADVSSKLIDQFVACLETRVLGPGVDEVAAAGAETETETETPAPAPAPGAAKPTTSGGNGSSPSAGGSSQASAADPGATGAPTGTRRIDAPEVEAIDLLDAGGATAKRMVPVVVALVVVLWLLRRKRR